MEKFMLSKVNSFNLMKSNHEYQSMRYFSATLYQNLVPKDKME